MAVTEQTELVSEVNVTGNPELAIAVIVKEASVMPRFCGRIELKAIVCAINDVELELTVKLCVTGVAAA